jgi:hypothetical protein
VAILAAAFFVVCASAQSASPNTVTFENQSGQGALVKLVGPTRGVVPVPNRSRAGIHVQAGEYYILVRYGAPGHYSYSKGQRFSVEGSGATYSVITITLHKVLNGNYASHPVNPAEFERR